MGTAGIKKTRPGCELGLSIPFPKTIIINASLQRTILDNHYNRLCCSGGLQWKKKTENRYKYQDLAGELKKIWNMKVTVITIVISVLETIH